MRFALLLLVTLVLMVQTLFVLIWIAAGGLFYVSRIYGPTRQFPYELGNEALGQCGPSTDTLDDLIVTENTTNEEASTIARDHGLAIIDSLISKDLAQRFRDYVMKANQELESAFIMHKEHRYNIMPPPTEPIALEMIKAVSEHPQLRPLLDDLLGPSASFVTFVVITNEFGATDQAFHSDQGTSHASYPNDIVREYSLAIALQDTTEDMGATGVCPGTHKCSMPDADYEELEYEYENEYSGDLEYEDWLEYHFPCSMTATLKQGDALLYNTAVQHRGRAHTDPNAPDRAQLFFTFVESRKAENDTRWLPLNQVYALDWRMWGRTIDELVSLNPWSLWRVVGLFHGKHDVKPWSFVDVVLMIFASEDDRLYAISDEFDEEYFQEMTDKFVATTAMATVAYLLVMPLVYFGLGYLIARSWAKSKLQMNGVPAEKVKVN